MDPVALILIVLIVLAVAALAVAARRRDRHGDASRGAAPGTGYHELRSDYQSGMGGGHETSWRVPRDPQEYAKLFVPKQPRMSKIPKEPRK